MQDYPINVFYSEEDEGYIADIPDLSHCSAFGMSPEEALREVLKAKKDGSRMGVCKPRFSGGFVCVCQTLAG